MKRNGNLVKDLLNELLADELSTIGRCTLYAHMCENWGYPKLHDALEKQAKDEMAHAEALIKRIMSLGGEPDVPSVLPNKIGKTVKELISSDREAESASIRAYNVAIFLAKQVGDSATAEVLTNLLKMEKGHEEWARTQLSEVERKKKDSTVKTPSNKQTEI